MTLILAFRVVKVIRRLHKPVIMAFSSPMRHQLSALSFHTCYQLSISGCVCVYDSQASALFKVLRKPLVLVATESKENKVRKGGG